MVQVKAATPAGFTLIGLELVGAKPDEAKLSVTLPALVNAKPEKVAVPLLAVMVVVPCKLPTVAVALTWALDAVRLLY